MGGGYESANNSQTFPEEISEKSVMLREYATVIIIGYTIYFRKNSGPLHISLLFTQYNLAHFI